MIKYRLPPEGHFIFSCLVAGLGLFSLMRLGLMLNNISFTDDIPARSIDLPMDTNVGVVVRRGKVIIHSGDTVLKAGDRLIIFSMKKAIPMTERFLAL
ncbi:MAG: hypothetical protein J7K15_13300 [Deltaproteobacteria bacterium]|nr:hypothetical protein [Deltaproteobacteria bacterium]